MQAVSVNLVSDELIERLQRLAQEHGSDVQLEAIQCLERGLTESEQIEFDLKELRELRSKFKSVWLTDEIIRAARDEGRE
jgi:hypothetical protein